METITVPPTSEMEISGKAKHLLSGSWAVERVPLKASVVARAVVSPRRSQGVCMRVINPIPNTETIYKGTKVADLDPVDDVTHVTAIQKQGPTENSINEQLINISRQCHMSV